MIFDLPVVLRYALALNLCLLTTGAAAQQSVSGDLVAAAQSVDITPTRPTFIAGYGRNRLSIDVHDRLSARCIVLGSGKTRIAIVSCDLIGVPRYEASKIRTLVTSVPAEHLFIAATHTHSGPDTLGQWGPDIQTRGVDEAWIADLRVKVARMIDSAASQLRPADLLFAKTSNVTGISKNIRVPRILDTELSVMQLRNRGDGKCIATMVNYACHPEVLNTRRITADFPHWLYETVEAHEGGVCLYMNGAQGGMVTADFDESTAPKGQNWAAAESIGKSLGSQVLAILPEAEKCVNTAIRAQQSVFSLPLENTMFLTLIKLHVLKGETLKNNALTTEVNRFTIGPAEFLTIPGEALPNVGFYLKRQMTGKYKFLCGLTCDFLGYILAPEDFGLRLYEYESGVSVGPKMEPLMVRNLLDLMSGKDFRSGPAPGTGR